VEVRVTGADGLTFRRTAQCSDDDCRGPVAQPAATTSSLKNV